MPPTIAKTAKGPIEYRLEGSGPTVMILNGGHCSRESRLSHEQLTAEGFSVLTPSRPGYDDTPSDMGRTAQEAADALAALLDTLQLPLADVIGISAAGPTALAFVQRHPSQTRKLILESAMATDWDEQTKRRARVAFGRAEKVTWAIMHMMLKLFPTAMIKALMHDLTILDIDEVVKRMSPGDLDFIKRMIQTSRSGTGFMNDIEHSVDNLAAITKPVLVMYSPNDKTVSPKNAQRVAREVATCELYEVPSDTHLIWIGKSAKDVWQKRLSFLRS
jgi:pimeloyl-ACP methyl ester carboxylesterase